MLSSTRFWIFPFKWIFCSAGRINVDGQKPFRKVKTSCSPTVNGNKMEILRWFNVGLISSISEHDATFNIYLVEAALSLEWNMKTQFWVLSVRVRVENVFNSNQFETQKQVEIYWHLFPHEWACFVIWTNLLRNDEWNPRAKRFSRAFSRLSNMINYPAECVFSLFLFTCQASLRVVDIACGNPNGTAVEILCVSTNEMMLEFNCSATTFRWKHEKNLEVNHLAHDAI